MTKPTEVPKHIGWSTAFSSQCLRHREYASNGRCPECLAQALAAALKLIEEYGQHSVTCAAAVKDNYHPPIDAEGCDCGLSEKWKAVKG